MTRPGRLGATDISVTPFGGQWVVRRVRAARRIGVYPTQEEAISAAQALTRQKGGQVVVQDRDGATHKRFTLGRLAFEKISAVEGIRLSKTMKQDLRRSMMTTDTPEAARQVLIAKYGKTNG